MYRFPQNKRIPAIAETHSGFSVIVFGLLLSVSASAQSTLASLLGAVKDASGAVAANCVISAENSGTAVRGATLTDSAGNYTVSNLEPGTYGIEMEASGFQTEVIHGISITGVRTAGPLVEFFPSFNSIGEIRIRALRRSRCR